MQHKKVDCVTISVANSMGMGGRATADEVHGSLRIRKGRSCIAAIVRYGLCGAAIALLPFQPATADPRTLPTGFLGASTLGSNGDQNPYGVAFVPPGFPSGGPLSPGNILVSNFNNAGTPPTGNIQGTGTTIVQVTPDGGTSTFFIEAFIKGQQGGLTTALGVLKRGFVIVGQVPNSTGTQTGVPTAGSLLFINKSGTPVTYTNPNLVGPWDLAIDDDFDHAKIFVSNVLNGTVVRLNVSVGSTVTVNSVTVIANGYAHSLDPTVFALGPTGLAYDQENDILYVASTQDNEIFKILNAGARTTSLSKGILVYNDPKHLRGPLGLVLAPNGNLLTANGDAPTVNPPPATPPPLPSEIVEFTKQGNFIAQLSIDPVAGAAFGIALAQRNDGRVHFAAVNDDDADLILLNLNNLRFEFE
jgi:hypothetical protein